MTRRLHRLRIWGAPVALAGVTSIGLFAALLFDGIGDAASWFLLGVPVTVSMWYLLRRTD